METGGSRQVTELLVRWRQGDREALDRLVPLVYEELRHIAQHFLQRERPAKGKSLHDEFRCEFAASQVKSGRALLALGKGAEAEESLLTAIETLRPSLDAELGDVPAYYVAADANAGMGDVAASQTLETKDLSEKQKLQGKACEGYSRSMEFWRQIPNPPRISSSGFLVQSENEVASKHARCKRASQKP
ncbi:MAG TPA: ECF-type sigma factor [Candidatus Acidoferrum sp.]|nr:ECF-type sigma factor [Candidatus Acidoferrum sp.]